MALFVLAVPTTELSPTPPCGDHVSLAASQQICSRLRRQRRTGKFSRKKKRLSAPGLPFVAAWRFVRAIHRGSA
jgi:hypothetical protein